MQLNQKGITEYTLKEVVNKIKKLRLRYKSEKDKTRKSGQGAGKKWKYFDAMDRFLAQRPSVTPLAVNDTFAQNEDASSNTRMTEIDCGNKSVTFVHIDRLNITLDIPLNDRSLILQGTKMSIPDRDSTDCLVNKPSRAI